MQIRRFSRQPSGDKHFATIFYRNSGRFWHFSTEKYAKPNRHGKEPPPSPFFPFGRQVRWLFADEYCFAAKEYWFGSAEYYFSIEGYWFDADEYWFSPKEYSFELEEYSFGVNEYWFSSEEYWFTVKGYSSAAKEYSFTVEEYSFSSNQYWFELEEYYFGADEYCFAVNGYWFTAEEYSSGSNEYSFGVAEYWFGVNGYSFRQIAVDRLNHGQTLIFTDPNQPHQCSSVVKVNFYRGNTEERRHGKHLLRFRLSALQRLMVWPSCSAGLPRSPSLVTRHSTA